MSLEDILKKELSRHEEDKETISIILEKEIAAELDSVIQEFHKINPEKTFTRQRLIEIAIDNLIRESKKVISELEETSDEAETVSETTENIKIINREEIINMVKPIDSIAVESKAKPINAIENDSKMQPVNNAENEYRAETQEGFDTVIFSAYYDGFKKTFLGENKWCYVRLGKDKLEKIKYVSCYVGAPVSAITHYAKVERIEEVMWEGKKKYIIYFDGEAVKLEQKIPMGNLPAMTVRANRYVFLEELMRAETYKDLL